MGALFREYWLPAMLSTELPDPDGDQVRVKLLGEELIGFRDSDGTVGLIQNSCPHRGASLFYARNEQSGIRCIYHGWKFDTTGACVDMPNEPAQSNFKDRVKATAYPTVERGGVIWAYMGPRKVPPSLPHLEDNSTPGCTAYAESRNCNWMQALEGDIDTVHLAFLHAGHLRPEDAEGSFLRYQLAHPVAKFTALDTPWGESYAANVAVAEDRTYCRVAHFFFPSYTMPPQGVLMMNGVVRAWVPMDDEHVMWYFLSSPIQDPELLNLRLTITAPKPGKGFAGTGRRHELLPNSSDWYGRFRPAATELDDFGLDRDAWRRGDTYSGLPTGNVEDQVVTETMGPVAERTGEHLVSSDVMIVRTRNRLIEAALALWEKGIVPPGVDDPEVYEQRAGGLVLGNDVDWFEATAEARRAFVVNPTEKILASVKI